MEPHNRNTRILALVEDLATLLRPYDVVGIRLEYTVTPDGTSRRIIIPERHNVGTRFALISPRGGLRERGIKSMVHMLPIKEADAIRVLDLANELSDINDMGSWPFDVTPREPELASSFGVGETPYRKLPGFRRRFNNIRDTLKDVARVDIPLNIGRSEKKGNSRKSWMRFIGFDDMEITSISTNVLARSLREWYGPDEAKHAEADARLGRWANQLGVSLDDFLDAALDLLQFESMLEVSGLDLTEEA